MYVPFFFRGGTLLPGFLCLVLLATQVFVQITDLRLGKALSGEQTVWQGCKREGAGVCVCLFAC